MLFFPSEYQVLCLLKRELVRRPKEIEFPGSQAWNTHLWDLNCQGRENDCGENNDVVSVPCDGFIGPADTGLAMLVLIKGLARREIKA